MSRLIAFFLAFVLPILGVSFVIFFAEWGGKTYFFDNYGYWFNPVFAALLVWFIWESGDKAFGSIFAALMSLIIMVVGAVTFHILGMELGVDLMSSIFTTEVNTVLLLQVIATVMVSWILSVFLTIILLAVGSLLKRRASAS